MNLFWMDQGAANSNLKILFSLRYAMALIVLFFALSTAGAQITTSPPLERVVTITFYQERLDLVLSRLSKEGKFTFSYNPSIIDSNGSVSGSFVKKTIREILNQLFDGKIQFKQKGNYIILTKASTSQSNAVAESLVITGYIINGVTEEKIPEVSIYDKKTFSAAVSNEYGFFKLKIESSSVENYISINKRTFRDTIMIVSNGGEKFVNFILMPESVKLVDTLKTIVNEPEPRQDTISTPVQVAQEEKPEPRIHKAPEPEEKEKVTIKARRWIKSKMSKINMLNIRDTLHRVFQVSYLPFLGTNHKLSGNVINDYSLNIIGGYSMGTNRAEVGGVFNIDRGDVKYAQVAGTFNAVGGKMTGVQVAGVINANNKEVVATQVAGTLNINLSSVHGVQVAGVMNMNGYTSKGIMVAGVGNIQVHDYTGSQIAGVYNISTHRMTGSQLSGLLNIANKLTGSQVGIVNVADTIKGVPVGILSFVRQGYHKIEVSADEIFYANLAFRTGVHQFYNIFSAGVKPDTFGNPAWALGYGVGSAPRITKWLSLNFDLTASHVERGHLTQAISLLNRLYVGVDLQIAKKCSITFGGTLNGYLSDREYPEYRNFFDNFAPRLVASREVGDESYWQAWWGAKVGVRFL